MVNSPSASKSFRHMLQIYILSSSLKAYTQILFLKGIKSNIIRYTQELGYGEIEVLGSGAKEY